MIWTLKNKISGLKKEKILFLMRLCQFILKNNKQDIIIDASMDIRIFSGYIAPELGITVRFAGEEPLDNITKQYNREMERTLPEFNIEFIEIARKESNEEVISTSRIRNHLKTVEWDEIKKLVPVETFNYLKDRNIYE